MFSWKTGHNGVSVRERNRNQGEVKLFDAVGVLGCLQKLSEALHIALAAIDETQSAECVALELRVALQALGEIVGIVTNEVILDQIFKEFCIGE